MQSFKHYLSTGLFCVLTILLASDAYSAPQSYNLLDYFGPTAVGTTWIYSGRDWDGMLSDTRIEIISTRKVITTYTDGISATPYQVTVIDFKNDYGVEHSYLSFTSTDEWHDYKTISDGIRMWGSDDGDEILRADGGLNHGTVVDIGQLNAYSTPAYGGGNYIGVVKLTVMLLDVSNITVPAGTFYGCLHLRFSLTGALTQTRDEWWAKGVGVVKLQGVSGDGHEQLRLLEKYSFQTEPLANSKPSPGINLLLLKGQN